MQPGVQPSTRLGRLVDDAPFRAVHWIVLALSALVLMLDGYDLSAMGFALPAISTAVAVPAAKFGPALSASLVGVAIGSLVAGPLGDRYGRRAAIIGCFLIVGAGALGTTLASSLSDFMVWRFFTGLGMGGVVPNGVALLSEFMPLRRRTFLVVAAFSTAAFGSSGGSLIAAALVPRFGWQAVFVVGGVGPLVATGLAYVFLPESPFFLMRARRITDARTLARRLGFELPDTSASQSSHAAVEAPLQLRDLFVGRLRIATWLIWLLFVGTQGLVFFTGGWLAVLLERAGLPIQKALIALSIFHMGSFIFGLTVAWQSDRRSPEAMLAVTYVTAAIAIALLSSGGIGSDLVYPLCFLAGGGVVGASFCLGALAASYYPPRIRAMGIGWGLGVGRIGSITSPVLGGLALGAGWSVSSILAIATLPAIACATIVLGLAMLPRQDACLETTS